MASDLLQLLKGVLVQPASAPEDAGVLRRAFSAVASCLEECCLCERERVSKKRKTDARLDEAWFSKTVQTAQGTFIYRQRVVAYRGWSRTWTSGHSLALGAQAIVDHGDGAPNLTVVIIDAQVTETAMNIGAEPRRCRVVPFSAQAVVQAACAKPQPFPRRIALSDAARELGQDAAASPLLLATDPLARFWLLEATVGDLLDVGAVGAREYRLYTQKLLPALQEAEP